LNFKTALPFALAILVAGCGGSSTGATSFKSIETAGNALSNEIFSVPYTDPSTLPTSGSASYNGYIGVTVDNAIDVAGELELTADFASDNITGSAFNFFDRNENAYAGTLEVSNGGFDRTADTSSEFTFGADLDGTLSNSGENIQVDASLDGDFTGSDYRYVEGTVFGRARTSEGWFSLDGGFVGER